MSQPAFAALTIDQFLHALASKAPTPGGGAVASVVGALAAASANMVVSYSLGKKNLADHQPALAQAAGELTRAAALAMGLADEDAAAYGLVNELSRLPEADPRRAAELPAALRASVDVPLSIIALSTNLLRLFDRLATMSNRQLRSDLGIAAVLAEAAARSAAWNVAVNAGFLPDPAAGAAALAQARRGVDDARALAVKVEAACA